MLIKTIISGFGGQGVLFMGYCLAMAAMENDYFTTYLPSYGPEVRGGTANCTVVVSDETIASPVASEPAYVVAMNNPSLARFQNNLVKSGSLFLNADMVDLEPNRKDVQYFRVPAVSIADRIGNPKGMNVVMLGAFIRRTELFSLRTMEKALQKIVKEKNPKMVEPNMKALHAGFQYWDEA